MRLQRLGTSIWATIAVTQRQIRHQPPVAGDVLARQHHGVANLLEPAQLRFDLAKLDAEAADLDLLIVAAQVLDSAVRPPAAQVPRLVQSRPRIGAKRRHHKTLRRQRRATPVAARYTCPTNVELPHHPDRDRRHPPVQYVDLRVRYRATNARTCVTLLWRNLHEVAVTVASVGPYPSMSAGRCLR